MSLAIEPTRLTVTSMETAELILRDAAAALRAGSPVVVFCERGRSGVLAFRAKTTTAGFFMVAPDHQATGTWPALDAMMPIALRTIESAFGMMSKKQ